MRRSAVVALLFIWLLAGCSGDDDGEQITAGAPSTSEPSTTTTTEATTTTTTAVPSTTAPPTTTTIAPSTTRPAPTTTSTTFPANAARVTLVNDYPHGVSLKLNGQAFELKAGSRQGPVAIVPAESNNDTVELRVHDDPSCGVGDADDKFDAGRAYTFRVFVQEGNAECGEKRLPSIAFSVVPA